MTRWEHMKYPALMKVFKEDIAKKIEEGRGNRIDESEDIGAETGSCGCDDRFVYPKRIPC